MQGSGEARQSKSRGSARGSAGLEHDIGHGGSTSEGGQAGVVTKHRASWLRRGLLPVAAIALLAVAGALFVTRHPGAQPAPAPRRLPRSR